VSWSDRPLLAEIQGLGKLFWKWLMCLGNVSSTTSMWASPAAMRFPRRQLASEEVHQPTEAQRRSCCPSACIRQSSLRTVSLCLWGATTCNSEIVSVLSNWEVFSICWRLVVLFMMLWWLTIMKWCNMGCSLTGGESWNYLHLLRWRL